MKIDEAIKINTEVAEMRGKRSTIEKREALWLGIEALKEIRTLQLMDAEWRDFKLAGETEK